MLQILGQEEALNLLRAAVHKQRVTTAYCFSGSRGIGKGLTARWFAQLLGCEHKTNGDPCGGCRSCRLVVGGQHPDWLWVEPTYSHQGKLLTAGEMAAQGIPMRGLPQIRLEQIQGVRQFTGRRPLWWQRSLVVVDGAETLAEPAANALLKTLEEPGHSLLILITPSPHDLLPTLLSRCQRIPFRPLPQRLVAQILQEQGCPDPAPALLSLSQGSPGLALQGWRTWQGLPAELQQPFTWPKTVQEGLRLGRTIARSVDVPTQVWLTGYWQHDLWGRGDPQARAYVERLETIREQLLAYVQPQLVWEIGLQPLPGQAGAPEAILNR
ncbi:MAG: DNA polymerase III subunit delta' [Thermostichales cyanobacterium DRC_bins_46]